MPDRPRAVRIVGTSAVKGARRVTAQELDAAYGRVDGTTLAGITRAATDLGFDARSVRDEKVKVLRAVATLDPASLVRGQFRGYRNEPGVGEGVKRSGFARDQLFITTKLWNENQGYDAALAAFDKSLGRLGME